jgi:hypothetical protein
MEKDKLREIAVRQFALSGAALASLLHTAFVEGVIFAYLEDEPGEDGYSGHPAFQEEGAKEWVFGRLERMEAEIKRVTNSDESGE